MPAKKDLGIFISLVILNNKLYKKGIINETMKKNIYPERNKEFLRNLRSCDGHTYAVTYSYCVAI